MTNVGKIFVDTKDDLKPLYAVGESGFICLGNKETVDGQFVPYDSCFTGPKFFDKDEFVMISA